jgi:hypothetical protein
MDRLLRRMNEYDFQPIAKHFQIYAIQDGQDRRSLQHLFILRNALQALLRSH